MSVSEYHSLIKEMPEGERPRERLAYYGPMALSDAELIAIALRTGTPNENALELAQRLLGAFRGLAGLSRASVQELCQVSGIGPAKATQVKAALELGRRMLLVSEDSRPTISSPTDAARLFSAQIGGELQEHLRVLILDTKHHVMRSVLIYIGNVNTSVIRVAEVFREAIKDNAPAIIVGHNHPSGDPTPSQDDIRVTRTLVSAGQMLDIKVLDHVVVGEQRFVSLRERGLGFE
jgi:DNA repair protein RadC